MAVRPAVTAQLTGLKSATCCIHFGIRLAARKVEDRKVSGSRMNCVAPISASSWRMIKPNPFDSAPNVDADARGRGAGEALIRALVREAEERGWSQVYWVTREGNARARRVYDRITERDDVVRYLVRIASHA